MQGKVSQQLLHAHVLESGYGLTMQAQLKCAEQLNVQAPDGRFSAPISKAAVQSIMGH
jgi:hypothetical protein